MGVAVATIAAPPPSSFARACSLDAPALDGLLEVSAPAAPALVPIRAFVELDDDARRSEGTPPVRARASSAPFPTTGASDASTAAGASRAGNLKTAYAPLRAGVPMRTLPCRSRSVRASSARAASTSRSRASICSSTAIAACATSAAPTAGAAPRSGVGG
eukprot:CAMPEP_0119429362 /NCGR_PEP_ID=MMETSP1335-20130426/42072_1 /TAXON_ID=259385 /ORGANISM="Chrysoculter rhomboideus, Strain RCC1486" /LENGTH=159 /DNA_ID=CAMNT_0007455077 /DNA_START=133 /DNA_END=608 /DNA_ORIENTATION=-